MASMTMLSDIRDRDERLAAHRETLEQKVIDRTRELASARDAAEKANTPNRTLSPP